VIGDINDREPAILQVFGGASCGEQFHAEFCQSFGKVEQTGFIRNREKGAGDGPGWKGEFREIRIKGGFPLPARTGCCQAWLCDDGGLVLAARNLIHTGQIRLCDVYGLTVSVSGMTSSSPPCLQQLLKSLLSRQKN
jgi:hypothetical protein